MEPPGRGVLHDIRTLKSALPDKSALTSIGSLIIRTLRTKVVALPAVLLYVLHFIEEGCKLSASRLSCFLTRTRTIMLSLFAPCYWFPAAW